jgi:hypothetical protein
LKKHSDKKYKTKPVIGLANDGKSFIFNSISEASRFIRSQDPTKINHKNKTVRSIRRNITLALETKTLTYNFLWKEIHDTNYSKDIYHDQELTNLVNKSYLKIKSLLPDGSIKEFNSFRSLAQYYFTYIFMGEHDVDFILNKIRNAYIYNKMKTKNPCYFALGHTFFDESFFIGGESNTSVW